MTLLGEDSISTGTFSRRLLNLYEVTKRHTKSVNVPITCRRAVQPPLAQEMVLSGPLGRPCWENGALTAGSEARCTLYVHFAAGCTEGEPTSVSRQTYGLWGHVSCANTLRREFTLLAGAGERKTVNDMWMGEAEWIYKLHLSHENGEWDTVQVRYEDVKWIIYPRNI